MRALFSRPGAPKKGHCGAQLITDEQGWTRIRKEKLPRITRSADEHETGKNGSTRITLIFELLACGVVRVISLVKNPKNASREKFEQEHS